MVRIAEAEFYIFSFKIQPGRFCVEERNQKLFCKMSRRRNTYEPTASKDSVCPLFVHKATEFVTPKRHLQAVEN